MKRDIFRRGVRMQHQFGDTERRNDPLGTQTFKPTFPVEPRQSSPSLEIQQYGEHQYREASSPIQKPGGGFASIQGPAPDYPQMCAIAIPVGTKSRKQP